jgi:hypothetical protein
MVGGEGFNEECPGAIITDDDILGNTLPPSKEIALL